jgi:hypothetical protein
MVLDWMGTCILWNERGAWDMKGTKSDTHLAMKLEL